MSPAPATPAPAPTPHRVVVLGLAPVVGYDLAIPPLLFGQARDTDGHPLYDVAVAGLGGRPVLTSAGYSILPTADETELARADTVVVPGTLIEGPRRHGTLPDDVADALATIGPQTRIMSICTGAFVLAAAGLLDGRPATTHWNHVDTFARLYPQVQLDPDVLFVDDTDLLTSAGLSAGIDLCLHVLRRDHGPDVANAVARHCVVPPWRDGGQAQFIERAVPAGPTESTAAVRDWVQRNLHVQLSLQTLAAQAGMSLRTFNRRFRAETGQAPGAWLIAQRVRHAQHLLERTDLPIDAVAARAGLGSSATLRQHLRSLTGVSPSSYRKTFRGSDLT